MVASVVEILGEEPADPVVVQRVVRAAVADPDYRPGFGFLRDRRGLGIPSTPLVHSVTALLDLVPGLSRTRWAVVVDCTAALGMARMAAQLTRTLQIEVFQDRAAAWQWLTRQSARGASNR